MRVKRNILNVLLILFIFFILTNIVVASPNTLDIEVPLINIFKTGQQIEIHAHVFNTTGYPLNGSTVSCVLILHNTTGHHAFEKEMVSYTTDFRSVLNSSVMNFVGQGSYFITCNTTSKGGVLARNILVSINGKEDNPNLMLPIILGLSIVIIMLSLLGWIAFKLDLDKVSFWVMFTSWSMAFIELVYMVGLLFINEAGGSLVGLLKMNFYVMAIVFFGVGFTVLITIYTRILSINKQDGKW